MFENREIRKCCVWISPGFEARSRDGYGLRILVGETPTFRWHVDGFFSGVITPQKINMVHLRIRAPWKRKIIF